LHNKPARTRNRNRGCHGRGRGSVEGVSNGSDGEKCVLLSLLCLRWVTGRSVGCSSRCWWHCLCMRQHICTLPKCKKGDPGAGREIFYKGFGGHTFICVAESTARKFRKWMHENPNKTSEQKIKPRILGKNEENPQKVIPILRL